MNLNKLHNNLTLVQKIVRNAKVILTELFIYLVGIEYVPCIQQYVSIVPPGTPSTIQSIGSPKYCFWPENIDAAIKIITDAL